MPCFSPLDATGATTVTRPRSFLRRHLLDLGAIAGALAFAEAALLVVVQAIVGGLLLCLACAAIGLASLLGG